MSVRVFWCIRLRGETDWFWARTPLAQRLECETRLDALRRLGDYALGSSYRDAKLVKVSKRPKPKPAPKVGDEVMVRAKLLSHEGRWERLQCPSGAVFSVHTGDIVR